MDELGDRKNEGKPGVHLLPLDALVELAKVYDYGSKKYSKRFTNEWTGLSQRIPSASALLFTPNKSVVHATNDHYAKTILNLQSVKELIVKSGLDLIEIDFESIANVDETILQFELNKKEVKDFQNIVNLELPKSLLNLKKLEDALCAVIPNTYTLIIAIPQGNTEEYFVVNTTTASGSLMMMFKNLRKQFNISKSGDIWGEAGDHNWERGLAWSKGVEASLLRHLARWHIGETLDEESGLPHDLHIAFNALALIAFRLRGIGVDDRHKL